MFLSELYQQKIIKNYKNFLVKDLKDKFVGTDFFKKVRIKIRQMNIVVSSNQILLESIDFLF